MQVIARFVSLLVVSVCLFKRKGKRKGARLVVCPRFLQSLESCSCQLTQSRALFDIVSQTPSGKLLPTVSS
jgi:hypothetical protein